MKHFSSWTLAATISLAVCLAAVDARDDGDKAVADEPPLLLRDGSNKELKLKGWKFTQGTRPLTWLLPMGKDADPKAATKPAMEALEFREQNSTTFVNGIVTLIPLDRLRSMDFNHETDIVTAKVTGTKPDADETLTGSTKYRGINKIAIDAEVDKGSLGVAEVKFLGGMGKGIKGLTFPRPKPAAALTGRSATVSVIDKDNKTDMQVQDLQALYRFIVGGEKLVPILHFKKTLKVDVGQVKKITRAEGEEGGELVWQVTLKDNEETLTLLQMVTIDGKDAVLVGLLGKVPAGYKLFPPHVIGGIEFDSAKEK